MGTPGIPSTVPPARSGAVEGEGAPRGVDGEDPRVPLRLTVTRGVLGMELYEPIDVGPVTVARLSLTLPNLRFPLDLSGGVPRFRHRRGELEHVDLELNLEALARGLDRRLSELLGPLARPVVLWPCEQGLSLGLVAESSALAFDLLWVPDRGTARFVVHAARGVGLAGPALGSALRALDSALPGVGTRRGRLLVIDDAGGLLSRALLPAVGARAAGARQVRFGELEGSGEMLRVQLDAALPPPTISAAATRALELSSLVSEADQALAIGEVDAARAGYVAALERAPRHPELVRLIAEIDLGTAERAEAALGLVAESMPVTQGGLVAAELLTRVGDLDAARQAIREVALLEPFAPLAALYHCRMAELEPSPIERVQALDRAVALAPGLAHARARRFEARLARGDAAGALADAEHLEAIERGASARHAVNLKAARTLFGAGFPHEAQKLFERALRYVPDDPAATAGLARTLVKTGRRPRAAALLSRAVSLAERRGRPDAHALIDLALLLADELKDLPQAIARVRQVPAATERAIEARFLEARWRANLGDTAGAALAFGRMREAVELGAPRPLKLVDYLLEAADFEQNAEADAAAAERHLAVALRVAPQDERVGRAYRRVASELAERARRARAEHQR